LKNKKCFANFEDYYFERKNKPKHKSSKMKMYSTIRKRNKGTERNYPRWFNKKTKQITIAYEAGGLEYSLNKRKRWESVRELIKSNSINIKTTDADGIELERNIKRNIYQQYEFHRHDHGYSKSGSGLPFVTRNGRNKLSMYKKTPSDDNIATINNTTITIPVKHHNQEYRSGFYGPCPCCFQREGRIWMLKGEGNRSLLKGKGMKRQKQRNANNYDHRVL
jgi:hypothetical protein